MAKLQLKKSYIPLEVEFDDGTVVTVKIDVREKGLYKRIKKLQDIKDDYTALADKLQNITKNNESFLDEMADSGIITEMAQALKKGLTLFISDESYETVLAGICAGDEDADPDDVNTAMLIVFLEVEALVIEHINSGAVRLNSYAERLSHYTAEVTQQPTQQPTGTTVMSFDDIAARDTSEVVHAQHVSDAE